MNEAISRMLQVVAILFLGKYLRYYSILKETTIDDIRNLIINYFLPCVLFISFTTMELTYEYFILFFLIFIMEALFWITSLLVNKIKWIYHPLIPMLCCGCAFGFIGIPLFLVAYEMDSLGKYTILGVGHEIFLWLFFFPWLRFSMSDQKFSTKEVLGILKSPIIISIITGLLINKFNMHDVYLHNILYNGIFGFIESLGSLTSPLILMVIGYEISLNFNLIKDSVKIVVLRLAIMFIVGYTFKLFIINLFMPLDSVFNHAFFTFLVVPAPMIVPMFASMYISDEYGQLASNVIAINTITSFLLYVVILFITS